MTLAPAIFGAENYGYRLGLLGVPTRVATAAAPLLFGLLIDKYGAGVLVFSSALSIAAFMFVADQAAIPTLTYVCSEDETVERSIGARRRIAELDVVGSRAQGSPKVLDLHAEVVARQTLPKPYLTFCTRGGELIGRGATVQSVG